MTQNILIDVKQEGQSFQAIRKAGFTLNETIKKVDYRDTLLIDRFASLFPFHGLKGIKEFSSKQVYEIKERPVFQHYLECYKAIVERIGELLKIYILCQQYEKVEAAFDQEGHDERDIKANSGGKHP